MIKILNKFDEINAIMNNKVKNNLSLSKSNKIKIFLFIKRDKGNNHTNTEHLQRRGNRH